MPSLTISLSENLMNIVKKRAKKNLQQPAELVEEIVRRSMLSYRDYGRSGADNITDDKLVNIFSRKKYKKKK